MTCKACRFPQRGQLTPRVGWPSLLPIRKVFQLCKRSYTSVYQRVLSVRKSFIPLQRRSVSGAASSPDLHILKTICYESNERSLQSVCAGMSVRLCLCSGRWCLGVGTEFMTKEDIVKHYPQYVDGLMQKEKQTR